MGPQAHLIPDLNLAQGLSARGWRLPLGVMYQTLLTLQFITVARLQLLNSGGDSFMVVVVGSPQQEEL